MFTSFPLILMQCTTYTHFCWLWLMLPAASQSPLAEFAKQSPMIQAVPAHFVFLRKSEFEDFISNMVTHGIFSHDTWY